MGQLRDAANRQVEHSLALNAELPGHLEAQEVVPVVESDSVVTDEGAVAEGSGIMTSLRGDMTRHALSGSVTASPLAHGARGPHACRR